MPGGRLTQQERQQIALGLADGLAYAEIARRLDRPTSTITREVMRNGGPTTYRAGLAHPATERRAHRRRRAGARGPQAAPQTRGRDADTVREYEEMFTAILMQSGLPKMMSRVLVCLYTTDSGSLTASELVQRLQVSPASISKAITFLEGLDLVRRERDERRRERYVVDDDVWYQSMMRSARDNAQLAEPPGRASASSAPTPGRRPPREHRPLPRLRRREHRPRRRGGPRGPLRESRQRPRWHRAKGATERDKTAVIPTTAAASPRKIDSR